MDAQGWRPIETAPKDGTMILIGGWEAYYPDWAEVWVPFQVFWDGSTWDPEGGPEPLPQCSHWHPMPPPPTKEP